MLANHLILILEAKNVISGLTQTLIPIATLEAG